MVEKKTFESLNGKLVLGEKYLIIPQSITNKLTNILENSKKPEKMKLGEIKDAYIPSNTKKWNKKRLVIKESDSKYEFKFDKEEKEAKKFVDKINERMPDKSKSDKYKQKNGTKKNNTEVSSTENKERSNSNKGNQKEYRRTCNQCGETWHILASREKKVKRQKSANAMQQCGAAMSCCFPVAAMSQSNVQDSEEQLEKMRSCPECGSHDYEEETITYEK